jgi:hypothetical protein
MKITKWLFVSGFLAALLLAGCFNPVSAPPSEATPASGDDTKPALLEPFTVTLSIDGDGSARAEAGPTGSVIGKGGICNFIQLAVVDPATGKVHTLTDARQKDAAQKEATLRVKNISYGKNYEFLLLMGHWERDYGAETPNGDYRYVADRLPTLLAVGRTMAHITTADNTITITLYPLVVDTKFTTIDNARTVKTVKNGKGVLTQGTWKLVWEITRGTSGTNGFTDLFVAQKTSPLFKDTFAQVGGSRQTTGITLIGNTFTLDAGFLAKGAKGYANFNLSYVPFSLNTADQWNGFSCLNKKDGFPEWIIRNGVNDLAQDADTDFTTAVKWDGTKNGNGAVGFTVVAPNGGLPGNGDNTIIDEENLLDVLGVSTVADAIEELHQRLNNVPNEGGTPYLDSLKLGMYLDLTDGIDDGSSPIAWKEEHENLRIVIASFDQYKDGTNTLNHIKFVFKNSPVSEQMRNAYTNDGGYPKADGDVVLKPYLEGGFFNGLKAALGHDYFYEVTRKITGGSFGAWTTVGFSSKLFIDTEKEVFGTNTYGDAASEAGLRQTALYKIGGAAWRIKKCNGSASVWGLGSPSSGSTSNFCAVLSSGAACVTNTSYVYGFAPVFCIR